MRPAPEYADLGGGLFAWQAYDSASKVDLHASAVTGEDHRLYFIDPIPLANDALVELTFEHRPAGIILTNANHARAADFYRQLFRVPVCIHPEAAVKIGLEADVLLDVDGGPVFGGVFEAIPLPGAAPGEIALYREEGVGMVIMGDAIINLPSHGFTILPDKYCTDPKQLRRSLVTLRRRSYTRMLFAHGEPILANARHRLETLFVS